LAITNRISPIVGVQVPMNAVATMHRAVNPNR